MDLPVICTCVISGLFRQRAVALQRAGCVFRCLESAAADVSSDVEPPPPRWSVPVCVTPDTSTGGSCENTSSSGQRRQAFIEQTATRDASSRRKRHDERELRFHRIRHQHVIYGVYDTIYGVYDTIYGVYDTIYGVLHIVYHAHHCLRTHWCQKSYDNLILIYRAFLYMTP